MRISDWRSDVCSSDLRWSFESPPGVTAFRIVTRMTSAIRQSRVNLMDSMDGSRQIGAGWFGLALDRKSVVEGKSVSVRLDLGGLRIIKKKNSQLFSSYICYNIRK